MITNAMSTLHRDRRRWATAAQSLRDHWPEYAIEAWALGTFMLSAAVFATLFDNPGSPLHGAVEDADVRRMLVGVAMGLTAIGLIYSPWGQRSGAHMNPAVTLTFLRLGRIKGWDAAFYVLAQFVGGIVGVLIAAAIIGPAFTESPVNYAVTQPGNAGVPIAFAAEFVISTLMMWTILEVSSDVRIARYTGLVAGLLVAIYITFEAPLSGMSMNPARTFASALPGGLWTAFWVYLSAPLAGMQLGALLHQRRQGAQASGCAKLMHGAGQRCIHCGFEPSPLVGEVQ